MTENPHLAPPSMPTVGPAFVGAVAVRDVRKASAVPSSSAAERAFEQHLLKTVLEDVIPADADAIFGSGLAGDMWRSLFAEHLAAAVSAKGGLGLAGILDLPYAPAAASSHSSAGS